MGTFRQAIQLGDPSGQRFQTIEALVDTGATYMFAPASLLRALGVEPIERWPFRMADERRVEYEVGEVRVRIDGRERTTLVVFGEEGAEPLLGAYTLEGFGLAVDPVSQRLVPVDGLLKAKRQEGDMDLYTVGIWRIKAGREDDFAKAWEELLNWTAKNQPGSKGAYMLQDPADPQRFITFGLWESEEAAAAWRTTPRLQKYGATIGDMVEEGSTQSMQLRTKI